jgi:hypothetical protein
MKTPIWIFGVICGVVFISAYENAPGEENKLYVALVAFFGAFAFALADGILSLPKKKNDEETKRDA